MKNWQEDLLSVSIHAGNWQDIFNTVEMAIKTLEFEYCSYGFRFPVLDSGPRTLILNNYPKAWEKRYIDAHYLDVDPTVLHGARSQTPLLWNKKLYEMAPQFWDEARSFGLRHGWCQSSLDGVGIGGMISLSRSAGRLTKKELAHKEMQMRWLTHVAHMSFSRVLDPRQFFSLSHSLTPREIEVLKWSAEGKSSQEVADILKISKYTVDFHVRNAIVKLRVTNKIAAVVRAALLGLLNLG